MYPAAVDCLNWLCCWWKCKRGDKPCYCRCTTSHCSIPQLVASTAAAARLLLLPSRLYGVSPGTLYCCRSALLLCVETHTPSRQATAHGCCCCWCCCCCSEMGSSSVFAAASFRSSNRAQRRMLAFLQDNEAHTAETRQCVQASLLKWTETAAI
jgi:hypothetical protein